MADEGAGYSINPASTAVAGLENYFDNTNKSASSGTRAPVINIATGGSKLTPNLSADGGGNWITYAIVAGAVLGGLYLWKGRG